MITPKEVTPNDVCNKYFIGKTVNGVTLKCFEEKIILKAIQYFNSTKTLNELADFYTNKRETYINEIIELIPAAFISNAIDVMIQKKDLDEDSALLKDIQVTTLQNSKDVINFVNLEMKKKDLNKISNIANIIKILEVGSSNPNKKNSKDSNYHLFWKGKTIINNELKHKANEFLEAEDKSDIIKRFILKDIMIEYFYSKIYIIKFLDSIYNNSQRDEKKNKSEDDEKKDTSIEKLVGEKYFEKRNTQSIYNFFVEFINLMCILEHETQQKSLSVMDVLGIKI